MPAEMTFDEVERMRQIVQMHDAQRKPMETIDLNNPPKEQYRFQKFPMMIYGAGTARTIVRSESELQVALSDGWSQQPPAVSEERIDPILSPAYQAEVGQLQDRLEQARHPRNRKGNEAA